MSVPKKRAAAIPPRIPFEDWRYRYIEGIGNEVIIEFVDDCQCGAYEMTMDRSKKDALLHTPNGGLTDMEQMGISTKADRFNGKPEALGVGPHGRFETAEQGIRPPGAIFKLNSAPPIKFKDLAEQVGHHITYNPDAL